MKLSIVLKGLVAILFAVVVSLGSIYAILTQDGLRARLERLWKYNPVVNANRPTYREEEISLTHTTLRLEAYNLAGMGAGLVSGGGALAVLDNGILVAERSGGFFFIRPDGAGSMLNQTSIAIDINQEGFERQAKADGYAVKPGRNVGYAGLGMRLHDLLVIDDGEHLLASFTRWDDARSCAEMHVFAGELNVKDGLPQVGGWRDVFTSAPCLPFSGRKGKPFAGHQAGGRMAEMADGRILMTLGDFKLDGFRRKGSTRDEGSDYGKLHVIDLETATSAVFSTGHRNPQGLVIGESGEIWSTEHGPTGGDELNLIRQGDDYGWPLVTYGRDCGSDCDWQLQGRHDGFVLPLFSYVPSIGISNLIQLRGFMENWDGDLMVASLKQETLHHLTIRDRRVVYDEPIRIGRRIRDIHQMPDGRIALWTDSGELIFLSQRTDPSFADLEIAKLTPAAQAVVGDCAACHSFGRGNRSAEAVSLWGINGRAKAAAPNFPYSDAMIAAGGVWDEASLSAFLADPSGYLPDGVMPYEGIADTAVRAEVVAFLKRLQ